jgi:hypothetical protein
MKIWQYLPVSCRFLLPLHKVIYAGEFFCGVSKKEGASYFDAPSFYSDIGSFDLHISSVLSTYFI